jgi:hypothetical protein
MGGGCRRKYFRGLRAPKDAQVSDLATCSVRGILRKPPILEETRRTQLNSTVFCSIIYP